MEFNILQYVIAFIGSILFSLIFIAIYRKIALNIGLVDKPNQRKVHTDNIPLVGGIGIFSTVLLMNFIDTPTWLLNYEVRNLFLGAGIILIMGIFDDRYDLKATLKLTIQLFLAHFMYYHGVAIDSLHGFLGFYQIPILIQHIMTIVIITGV
ncbi:MAG: hypothetical protein RLZZ546_1641, partial [Bacteroidota bacterium]